MDNRLQRWTKSVAWGVHGPFTEKRVGLVLAFIALVCASNAACDTTNGGRERTGLPDSYQACVAQGGRVEGAGERRCTTETGLVFSEPQNIEAIKAPGRSICKDLCGDGACQEMVCMAIGCPCAESSATCPVDCKGETATQ